MHLSFLEYLRDPLTGEELSIHINQRKGDEVIDGTLISSSNSYPIIRGIPRFSGHSYEENYTSNFGYQWNRWAQTQFESKNMGMPMEGHTGKMWRMITGLEDREIEGKLVGDFGCGSGRFIEIARMKKGKVIGIDLSDAVESAREFFQDDPGVLICQADILQPPLAEKCLDIAFSIGVLHHTPDPEQGFLEIARRVKPGGKIAVSVYGKGGHYDFSVLQFYRKLFKALWPTFGHLPPLIYSWFTTYVVAPFDKIPIIRGITYRAFPHIRLADPQWSYLDTFDSITTSYQSGHDFDEVYQWFIHGGLDEIEKSEWGGVSVRGKRLDRADNQDTVS